MYEIKLHIKKKNTMVLNIQKENYGTSIVNVQKTW